MSSRRWFLSFLSMILAVAVLVAAFNFAIDPFGVFGDRFFDRYSLNLANNPKIAKIAYLDKYFSEYDSYIIGGFGANAYSVDMLNLYTDGKFYNLAMPDVGMYDIFNTASYVIDNYDVKNIVLPITLLEIVNYKSKNSVLTDNMHVKAEGGSDYLFYLKYLYANPDYSLEKMKNYFNDSFLPKEFNSYTERTGAYDRSVFDIEPISDAYQYLAYNTSFSEADYSYQRMEFLEECMECISAIKEKCEAKGISFALILSPEFYLQKSRYSDEELGIYMRALSNITDFWDFSFSPVSSDARYFYDAHNMRNALGSMLLAKIYSDDRRYSPDDFGYYVTALNVEERIAALNQNAALLLDNSQDVPILRYSYVDDEFFSEHVEALSSAGYETIMIDDILDYVGEGKELPEKPIIITIDDCSKEGLNTAYSILMKYNFRAEVFIGNLNRNAMNSINTMSSILTAEIYSSGFVNNRGVYNKNEEIRYVNEIKREINKTRSIFYDNLEYTPFAFVYNRDEYSVLNEVILHNANILVTFVGNNAENNTIIKGIPQSLKALTRINVTASLTPEELLNMINNR